ncbi:MAG: DUF433 domain-containing protein [Pirellulaceae bacterium]|nr:DUF433 domain-containing protein [Pirellulaceae bacterium]
MAIEGTTQNERFLESAVAQGAYSSREEALDRAVQLLRERHEALSRIEARSVEFANLPPELELLAGGGIRFRGTRVSLELVLSGHFAGDDSAALRQRFPTVSPAQLEAALAYVARHESQARAYLDQRQTIARLLCDDVHRGPSPDELRARFPGRENG